MLLAVWLPSVGTFGILLAVYGFIVSVLEFKGWTRIVLCGVCIVLGVGELLSIHRADHQHDEEIRNQHADVENLRADLHKSEIERQVSEAYLKAKLEDEAQFYGALAQLAPAIKTLAQTSAEFQRKQYETKITSDKELYNLTMNVVQRIRDFSTKYQRMMDQNSAEQMSKPAPNLNSEADKLRYFQEETQKELQLYRQRDSDFHVLLPDILYAKAELERRKLPVPAVDMRVRSDVDMVLRGILAGPYPELTLADYLQLWVKPLSGK